MSDPGANRPAPAPSLVLGTATTTQSGAAVAPKNPALHLIVSVFLPGVGSMMNGDVGKGVGILLGYFFSLLFFWLLIPLFIALGLWIWGLVDAYQGAQKWNQAHGIIS